MLKKVLKRFSSLMLAALLILSLCPTFTVTAYAETSGPVTGLSDSNIGLSYTHSGDKSDAWSASGTTITGSVVSTTSSMGCTDNWKSTLTITNKKTTSATLSFDYAVEVNSGTIQVGGNDVSAGGSFFRELAAGDSIKVYLESGSTTATKITMINVALVADATATTTFQPAENGSFTVDGNAVTENYSITQSSAQGYAVVATPASGYQFMGWYDVTNGKYISTDASTTLNMENDATITARFAPLGVALFDVGGQVFEDLGEATAYATDNRITKVTLVSDGTLTGSYTIPAGVVLLIPFDEAKTLYTDTPVALYGGGGTRVAYKTLTLANGASLTVNGGISVGGRYNSAAGSATGYMTGAYGLIRMESGSRITVESGGALYAWGFVTGSGNVTVESGGSAYEWFQIADFRGGTASGLMGKKVFPFSQYFVQNVEVPLTLNAGAKEIVYTGVYAGDKVNNASIAFVGDSGMFKVVSGSVTKVYDGAADRLRFTINGEMELNNLALKLAGMNVNSANYVLPITNNISLEIASGKLTVNQATALLAGVNVTVDQGAELLVSSGTSVYLYDRDEWTADNYVVNGKFKTVTYAPGKAYNRTDSDLVDARIDVCGTMTAAGSVYTTTGGADICSVQGTGVYQQIGAPGTETVTYQYTQSGSKVTPHDISITPAKLHNADGSYTETANASAGDVINYVDGFWGGSPVTELTITFNANEGDGSMDAQTVTASTDTALTANIFTREGYTFTGWNTEADGSGTPYEDEATVNLTEDITLYAQWKINTYTVTWVDENGDVLETDTGVAYGTTPEYNGETPTKEGDAQYSYTFNGWDPALAPVSADVTYKPVYKETVNKYAITWNNWDGTELLTEQVEYGQVPVYTGETPTRDGGAEYTYTFSGWTPDIVPVNGNAAYTAVFTDTINTYTVTWQNWNGDVLETDTEVDYGTTPEYNGETPTKEGDVQYSYTFTGWSPEVDTVTGDIIYTAVFEKTVNKYTITWKNWDDEPLKTEQVEYGKTPVYSGEAPTREGNAQYSYTFTGWTPDIEAVTDNAEYTAMFAETVNTYTVTWVDEDGTELEKDENVEYGATPSFDREDPSKEEDASATYTFTGWDPEVSTVTGNVTYTAKYEATTKLYTVTWVDENGTVLDTQEVEYGKTPVYPGETPTKADDNDYSYSFSGWTPDYESVTCDATYTATFTATPLVKHTITFDANGGEGSMEPQLFIQGKDTLLKANTFTRENYQFTGWNTEADGTGAAYAENGAIINLTEDITLYAQWKHNDGWFTDNNGKAYYVDGEPQKTGWTEIDGSTYYLDETTGYAAAGGIYWLSYPEGYGPDQWDLANNDDYAANGHDVNSYFIFNDEGIFQSAANGFYSVTAETKIVGGNAVAGAELTAWAVNGELPWHPGLVLCDGAYYYFTTGYFEKGSSFVSGQDYFVSKPNGLSWPAEWGEGVFTTGKYTFDTEGKLQLFDGLTDIGSDTYYYVKGVKTYAGLIQIGDDYYYVNSACKIIKNQSYTVSKTNGLLPSGTYEFDADGKMIREDTTKNGIVKETEDTWYYYVNGVKTYAGLIQIDGELYYVNSKFEVIHGRNYFISKTNGLLSQRTYYFNAEGVLQQPKESNGIVKESEDTWYYYVDGVKTYAGLIQIDGDYYYVNSSCKVIHNQSYFVSKTNGLMTRGTYEFGADGKMVVTVGLNGIVKESEDTWYYYVDGVKTYAGLIQIDGNYYYVNSAFKVIHGQSYFISKTNGLLPNGTYTFDADGKLVQ